MLLVDYRLLPRLVRQIEIQKAKASEVKGHDRKFTQAQQLLFSYLEQLEDYLQEMVCRANPRKKILSFSHTNVTLEFLGQLPTNPTERTSLLSSDEKVLALLYQAYNTRSLIGLDEPEGE